MEEIENVGRKRSEKEEGGTERVKEGIGQEITKSKTKFSL